MKPDRFSKVLKWVGFLTAILALVAGIRQIVKQATDRVEAGRKTEVLLSAESLQLQGHDYRSAWRSLEEASQIDSKSVKIQDAQETLAMVWLENIDKLENEKFSDITEKLEPILTRGVSLSKAGTRRADLMAHIGWTYFLRSREGRTDLDPAGAYSKAVAEDPSNPFAQAMWGHWILWNGGKLSDGEQHFASALQSNREGDYVRGLQLGALLNCHRDECEEETIRVVTAMRKEQRSVESSRHRRIFSLYYFRLLPRKAETDRFINAVSPAEHVATFRWLFDKDDLDDSDSTLRSYYLASLQEAAGQRAEALAVYKSIHSSHAGRPGTLLDAVDAGIKRLAHS